MPDLTGFPAVDVAIGLAFLFFLLSTACSAINEAIAAMLGWRAKTLEDGLARMLGDKPKAWWTRAAGRVVEIAKRRVGEPASGDLARQVLQHWSVAALARNPNSLLRRRRQPSYLPPDVVSLAVTEVLLNPAAGTEAPGTEAPGKEAPGTGTPGTGTPGTEAPGKEADSKTRWETTTAEFSTEITDALKKLPDGSARDFLTHAAAKASADVDAFRQEVESAFNDTMERASGWYKRKTQIVILILAIGITLFMNVNTITVATRLWNDDSLRNAVTAAAINATNSASGAGENGASASGSGGAVAISQSGSSTSSSPAVDKKTAEAAAAKKAAQQAAANKALKGCATASDAPGAPPKDPAACAKQKAAQARDAVASIDDLDLPLGWHEPNKPKLPGALLGWLITVFALSFGAPFWFDALNRFVRLRSSGVPAAPDTNGAVGDPRPATTNAPAAASDTPRPRRG
jgi:hypothetical protein